MNENYVGYFRGRKTIQRSATVGGARSVFVKLQGNKNELVYPTFGGYIKNPFKGPAKIFAGDLMEYRTDENGLNPEIYILKTYVSAKAAEGNVITLVNDGFKHIPFVGDKFGIFDDSGEVAITLTVEKVVDSTYEGKKVWECTMSSSASNVDKKGYVLVEVGEDGNTYPKNINAVAPTDLDMFDAPATGDEDFDGARYSYTPALGGIMYTNKMSPVPDFAKKFNKSNINGWFQIQSV